MPHGLLALGGNMRKRDGFISVIALIIMSILLLMVLYLGYTSQLEYLILNSSTSKTKGYYQSEGKLYLSLYDEIYYNNQLYLNIIDYFRNDGTSSRPKAVIIDDSDLEYGDSENIVELKYFEKGKRKMMDMTAESINDGIASKLTSSSTLVHEIFESGYSILSHETVDEKHREELGEILLQINEEINVDNCYRPESLFGVDLNQYNNIVFKKSGKNNYELSCERDTMDKPYVVGYSGEEAIIIARKPENMELDFYIGEPDISTGAIDLSGILYVNGNIIISEKIHIRGILIVENGEIIMKTNERAKISGLLIMNNMENYDDFIEKTDIIQEKRFTYRYGTYLPGFLDPKAYLMKNNIIRER